MAAFGYAHAAEEYVPPRELCGNHVPRWHLPSQHLAFGNVVVIAFLVAQCLDGVFTYVGVTTFGNGIEANPLIAAMMLRLGHGMALLVAKAVAASLGIALHLKGVHAAVAVLRCDRGPVVDCNPLLLKYDRRRARRSASLSR